MDSLPIELSFDAAIVASGAAAAPFSAFGAMRKLPPRFPGVELSGHFLKHADEQTILALEAIRRAVEQAGLNTSQHSEWGVVAAPRFIGRLNGGYILQRFAKGGGAAVPPHAVAQNSLHSMSGAASVALGIHGPNLGVGGGAWAIADGFAAALTLFQGAGVPGMWLLMTEWSPEPIPNERGEPLNETTCYAVAMAIVPREFGPRETCGDSKRFEPSRPKGSTVRLRVPVKRSESGPATCRHAAPQPPEPSLAQLAASLDEARFGIPSRWSFQLPWGASIDLQLAAVPSQRAAA